MTGRVEIEYPGGTVTGRVAGEGERGILLAHGAGTNQDHPFLVDLRDRLAGAGHTVMTFNYAYTERGVKRPDQPEKLLTVHRAAADLLGTMVGTVFLAGRSMGGRMGTMLAADGYPTAGLILYAYPLHPAGREERLRVAHLGDVGAPMLFFQGTRDALSRMELFDLHVGPLPGVTVEILDGADHSFRGGGWTPETVSERLTTVTTAWIDVVSSGRSTATTA
jgi:predicted alpha/beta-hydrolase family hydrolase